MRRIVCLLIGPAAWLLLGLTACLPAAQSPDFSARDLGVYRAVLADKIRPQVDRFSQGAGIRTPAPVLTFDRTIAICTSSAAHPRAIGCISDDRVQGFEKSVDQQTHLPFGGLLGAEARRELARSFRDRNAESHPFGGVALDGVISVAPELPDEALTREARRTCGFSSFSLPGRDRAPPHLRRSGRDATIGNPTSVDS